MTVPNTENAVTGLPKNMIDNQMRMARFTVLATECVTGEMRPMSAYANTDCRWYDVASTARMRRKEVSHASLETASPGTSTAGTDAQKGKSTPKIVLRYHSIHTGSCGSTNQHTDAQRHTAAGAEEQRVVQQVHAGAPERPVPQQMCRTAAPRSRIYPTAASWRTRSGRSRRSCSTERQRSQWC